MRPKTVVWTLAVWGAAWLGVLGCTGCAAGTTRESLMVQGMRRTYLVHVPAGYQGSSKLPLVVALHPFTGTGRSMERMTGLSALADRDGFLVVYPDGRGRVWNADPAAPASVVGAPADDVAFIAALVGHAVEALGADPSRVYVVGASSGGLMAHRVACELTGQFAAAASVMVTLPASWADHERPSRPLPFVLVQGTEDPFFPWEGGTVRQGPCRKSEYLGAAASTAYWVSQNHAVSPPVETALPDADPRDCTRVFRQIYAAGPGGAETVLYEVRGGGHTWPGPRSTGPRWLLGRTSHDMSATEVVWEFFKAHGPVR